MSQKKILVVSEVTKDTIEKISRMHSKNNFDLIISFKTHQDLFPCFNLLTLDSIGSTLVDGINLYYTTTSSIPSIPTSTDFLFSSKWPNGFNHNPNLDLSHLISFIKPKYIFSLGPFIEKTPFKIENSTQTCRFISLNSFDSNERWCYALNYPGVDKPKGLVDQWPWAIQEPKQSQQSSNGLQANIPPETYICKICNQPNHYISDCPSRTIQNKKKKQKQSCWFCLSNPQIETHLIVSVFDSFYLTIPKGLITSGHLIIVPVLHLNYIDNNTELDGIFDKILNGYKNKDINEFFAWSVFSSDQHHALFQVVPLKKSDSIIEKLNLQADSQGLIETPKSKLDNNPYIHVKVHLNGSSSDHYYVATRGVNIRFGAIFISEYFETPERAEWKDFVMSKEEEDACVEEWRNNIEA